MMYLNVKIISNTSINLIISLITFHVLRHMYDAFSPFSYTLSIARRHKMYALAYFFIVVGAVFWGLSIFIWEGNPTYQLISIIILTIGIFAAHSWEELFRDKEKK